MSAASTESVTQTARSIAKEVLAPNAAKNDREARFPKEAVDALGRAGLLGLTVPAAHGGLGLGPAAFSSVVATLAEECASTAMIYTMHVSATAVIAAAARADLLADIAKGGHLSTLAFSERGSRSHFWAPVSRAVAATGGVKLSAEKSWVTSAGHAQSYVTSALSPSATGPTESTIYLVRAASPGMQVAGGFDGLGLRANASAPMTLTDVFIASGDRLGDDGKGFDVMTGVVLPLFNLGSASMSLGLCRSALGAALSHVRSSRFEHLGATLAEALPTLRAQAAQMQIATDGLAARIGACVNALEHPGDTTMLHVLETKAAGADTAIQVTDLAMRTCGGAAFSKHLGIERTFRDARAAAVMAPTTAVLEELIGRAILGLPLF